ncbi:hypothetical protein D3C72_1327870 [compost metagenome]
MRLALREDMVALAMRVGHGGDACVRVALGHPQGQRAPAAPQFQDVLAVGQPGALPVQFQHRILGLVQRLAAGTVVAAAVLQAMPQAALEEGGGNLIVLAVGRIHMQGQRAAGQFGDAAAEALRLLLHAAGRLFGQALCAQATDARAQGCIRQPATLGPAGESALGIGNRSKGRGAVHRNHSLGLRGNQGKNIEVLRW